MSRGDLSAAHKGYAYQDLTVAFAFAETLVRSYESITVDSKTTPGDRFDDLIIQGHDGTVRYQIKWSDSHSLGLIDFEREDSSIRIDHLLDSFLRTYIPGSKNEFRLAVAWVSPSNEDLLVFLRETNNPPTIPGSKSRQYHLIADQIWPEGSEPNWQPLRRIERIERSDFISFAEHFVIETDTPSFSADLSNPGDLEQLLFRYLIERVGIGAYPNEQRRPADVAARLISMANWARTEHATLTPEQLARSIDLQIDFGYIPQKFPINSEYQIDRANIQNQLRRNFQESQIIALIGPPGSGKSWELSILAEDLRKDQFLVASHFCYLAPGDPDIERRITTDALYGNLITELISADRDLIEVKRRTYAATREELENLLQVAAKKHAPNPIVLIVDGIDHISRVLATSKGIAAGDTDIIEELATLSLPEEARLILGSQPGSHLEPLKNIGRVIELQAWNEDEIWALAGRFDLPTEVALVEDPNLVRSRLAERTEGNPLYATFLIRGILDALRTKAAVPSEWLETAPPLGGDIANYYSHLYDASSSNDRIVAEVLGLIDFAITESELGEIVGAQISRHIPDAVQRFKPILINVAGQGGLRVFHESFRRFMIEKLNTRGLSVDIPLGMIITWLKTLGFEENAKAFRFLLPALNRANRIDELLIYVGKDFVSKGVCYGHPREAIRRNLSLATEVAAIAKKWPDLVRCLELRRTLYTCFEEHLFDPLPYWQTFIRVFGPKRLSDRLLFDGSPTLDRHLGLILCSIIDDDKEVAPWKEYLALPRRPLSYAASTQVDPEWEGRVISALLHGRLRTENESEDALEWVRREFLNNPRIERPILLAIANRLASSLDNESFDLFLRMEAITIESRAILLLAYARNKKRQSETIIAIEHAKAAFSLRSSFMIAEEAIEIGALGLSLNLKLEDLDKIDIGLAGEKYHVDEQAAAEWVRAVRLLSHQKFQRWDPLFKKIDGGGWYRSWLRFIIQICQAEAISKTDTKAASSAAVTAFEELARDADPFTGRPRAVDLYNIRKTIHSSIARGFALLSFDTDWASALRAVQRLIEGTSAYLKGSRSGPIDPRDVAELLEPFVVTRHEFKDRILEMILFQVQAVEKTGEPYAVHANLEFVATRSLLAIGERERAFGHWKQAAVYLSAYGYHKDVTLYQLLEGLPGLPYKKKLVALEMLFPLAEAAIDHTDQDETKYLPNACLRQLAGINPAAALDLIARSQISGGGLFDWRIEEAAKDAVRAAYDLGDASLVALANTVFRFAPDYDEEALSEMTSFLIPIEKLGAMNIKQSNDMLKILAARVEGDPHHDLSFALHPLYKVADHINIKLNRPSIHIGPEGKPPKNMEKEGIDYASINYERIFETLFPPPLSNINATPLQIMTWVRDISFRRDNRPERFHRDDIVNKIGYSCIILMEQGHEEAAIRLIRFVSRQIPTYERNSALPLANLGKGFERYGLLRLAAITYTLAFVHSRGGGGWNTIGGDEHEPWLKEAIKLDPDAAQDTLAIEVVKLAESDYLMGVTPGLIKRIAGWGAQDTACACWDEAYSVIDYRLPMRRGAITSLLPFRRAEIKLWSVDESLLYLIAARVSHPELDRKRSALLALAQTIKIKPEALAAPLVQILALDNSPSSAYLILLTLLYSEETPYAVSRGLEKTLNHFAQSNCFGEQMVARKLLERACLSEPKKCHTFPILDKAAVTQHIQAALNLDWKDRIEVISLLWPDFATYVARRFEQLYFESEDAKKRAQDRFEFATRRDSASYWIPILGWEREMFELAFHETLNGLPLYLLSKGKTTIGLDEMLLERISPDIRLQLALDASRSLRPKGLRPSEVESGNETAPVLPDEDEFAGWRRVGWYERELIFKKDDFPFGDPEHVQFATNALVVSTPDCNHIEVPFGRFDPHIWFLSGKSIRTPFLIRGRSRGPIVGAERITDLLGSRWILALTPLFAYRYEFKQGPWPGPLRWLDSEGRIAVSFRNWKVRSITMQNEEPCILEGCELIIRPDLLIRIEHDIDASLTFAIRPKRQS